MNCSINETGVEMAQKKIYLLLQHCSNKARDGWGLFCQLRPFCDFLWSSNIDYHCYNIGNAVDDHKKSCKKVEKRGGVPGLCLLISLTLRHLRGLCNCVSFSLTHPSEHLDFFSLLVLNILFSSASFNSSSLLFSIFLHSSLKYIKKQLC